MRPVNDSEVLAKLDRRASGYGNGVKLARELGMKPTHLHSMKSGYVRVSQKVAGAMGFELMWVRKQGTEQRQQGQGQEREEPDEH